MARDKTLRTRDILDACAYREIDADHLLYRRFRGANAANLEFAHAALADAEARLRAFRKEVLENSGVGKDEKARRAEALHAELHAALKWFYEAGQMQEWFMAGLAPERHLYEGIQKCQRPLVQTLGDDEGCGRKGTFLLGASEKGPIHRFLDRRETTRKWFSTVPKQKEPREEEGGRRESNAETYSEGAVRLAEDIVVTTLFGVLVLLPIIGLSYVHNKVGKMILVFGSVLLVTVVNSFVANGVQRTTLGVVAAYTAVLAVFLGTNIG